MADMVVRWYKLGDEFTYDVWYADRPEGPWTKHNEIRLFDDILSGDDDLCARAGLYVLYIE